MTWPEYRCPPDQTLTSVEDVVNEIIFLAAEGLAPNLDQIIQRATRCLLNACTRPPPLDLKGGLNDEHSWKLWSARTKAVQRRWFLVVDELEHII
jgi:hypothetical protein